MLSLLARPKLIAAALVVVVFLGMAATIAWQNSSISGLKTDLAEQEKVNKQIAQSFTKYQADTVKLIDERNRALDLLRLARIREDEIRKEFGNEKIPVAPSLASSLDRMQQPVEK